MLQDKKTAYNYVQTQGKRLAAYHQQLSEIYKKVHDKYGVPRGNVADLLGGNVNSDDVDDLVLYGTIDYLVEFGGTEGVDKFYTEIEIKNYSKAKYKEETIEFPIRIKCVPVTNDQWIGATDTDFFMQLRKEQMINYNINAQRTMTRKKDGDNISWKISVNKAAVKKICDAYANEDYIPDTITLGIVEEANPDFYYDYENGELVIEKLDYFDIPDGYHRYLAMGNEKDSNKSFNYPMEIRIVNFTEDKTKQFIYQQDQKTKMKKIDSNSMNMNSPANIILERLNNDSKFSFMKEINRNEGRINFSVFATVIQYYYLKGIRNINRQSLNKLIISTENELVEGFNTIVGYYPELMEKQQLELSDLMIMTYITKEQKCDKLTNKKCKDIFKVFKLKEAMGLFKYKDAATLALHKYVKGIVDNVIS